MQVTEEMLQAAMKKAIEHGLLPRRQSRELYSQNETAMKDILISALDMANEHSEKRGLATSVISALPKKTLSSEYSMFRSDRHATYVHGVIGRQS